MLDMAVAGGRAGLGDLAKLANGLLATGQHAWAPSCIPASIAAPYADTASRTDPMDLGRGAPVGVGPAPVFVSSTSHARYDQHIGPAWRMAGTKRKPATPTLPAMASPGVSAEEHDGSAAHAPTALLQPSRDIAVTKALTHPAPVPLIAGAQPIQAVAAARPEQLPYLVPVPLAAPVASSRATLVMHSSAAPIAAQTATADAVHSISRTEAPIELAASPLPEGRYATSPTMVSAPDSGVPGAEPMPRMKRRSRQDIVSVASSAAPITAPIDYGAQHAPAAPKSPPATRPDQPQATQNMAEPCQGTIFLDGTLLGRWMIDHLARQATRPASGTTGIDPRINATFPGAPSGV